MEKKSVAYTEVLLDGRPGDRPWEGCVNSVNYRVPRGVTVRVPEFLARHIARTEAERRRAEQTAQRLASAAERI